MSEETQTVSEAIEQQTPDISDTSDIKSEEKDFVTAEDQAPATVLVRPDTDVVEDL